MLSIIKRLLSCCFVLFGLTTAVAQQQLQIGWDWTHNNKELPVRNSYSINYYHAIKANKGLDLRIAFLPERDRALGFKESQDNILQIDAAERWYLKQGSRLRLYGAAGLSAMFINQNTYRYYSDLIGCLRCKRYIEPPEQVYVYGFNYSHKDRHYFLSFQPGLTASLGLDLNITKHLFLSIQYKVNGYYNLEDGQTTIFNNAGLGMGYQF